MKRRRFKRIASFIKFLQNPLKSLQTIKKLRLQIFLLIVFVMTYSFGFKQSSINELKIPTVHDIDEKIIVAELGHTAVAHHKFTFPLPEKYRYYISSQQGLRDSIANVNLGGESSLAQYHNAIDFAVPEGTPVYAAKDGYVKTVYPSIWNGSQWRGHPTYGGLVELQHQDGTSSLYAHLVMTQVKEGTYVKQGITIGLSGGVRGKRGSGNSTGPHLHFSIYVDIDSMWLDF